MQTVNLSTGKASFTLTGPDVEPMTLAWSWAEARRKRAQYYPILARWVKEAKLNSLEAGEDARGNPLTPPTNPLSREWYRLTGREWRGPSMSPQYGKSRTQRLLAVNPFPRGNPDRVVGYWHAGFGRILHYHATGKAGKGRPYFDAAGRIRGWRGIRGATTGIERDVVGLSDPWVAWAVSRARAEWEREFGRKLTPGRLAMQVPAREPVPDRPAASPVEKYPFLTQFRPSSPIVPGVVGPAVQPSRVRRFFGAISKFFHRISGVFG